MSWRQKPPLGLMTGRRALTQAWASARDTRWYFMRYARHREAERLTPAAQCTSTAPRFRPTLWILSATLSKYKEMGEWGMSAKGTFTYSMWGQLKLGSSMVALTTQVMPFDSSRLRLDATFPLLRKRLGVICAIPPSRLLLSGSSLGTAVGTMELRWWWWWWWWKKPWLREPIVESSQLQEGRRIVFKRENSSGAHSHSSAAGPADSSWNTQTDFTSI